MVVPEASGESSSGKTQDSSGSGQGSVDASERFRRSERTVVDLM